MSAEFTDLLSGWVPHRLRNDGGICRWLYLGSRALTEPFFADFVSRCLSLPQNSSRYRVETSLSCLVEWTQDAAAVPPAAFIFHVSRCGSTLLSQSLALSPQITVLSEVPLFDELLRLPLRSDRSPAAIAPLFKGAMELYRRAGSAGTSQKMFVKTDSWHLMYWKTLRQWYPATPFIVLYREPGAVLASHCRRKGMQAVQGVLEPELFGKSAGDVASIHPDHYMAYVLEAYYNAILLMTSDDNTLLVDYREGILPVTEKVCSLTGIAFPPEYRALVAARSRFHSKEPEQTFSGDPSDTFEAPPNMARLRSLYEEIGKTRLPMNERRAAADAPIP